MRYFFIIILVICFGCEKKSKLSFEAYDFVALTNYGNATDSVCQLNVDLDNTVLRGITIPTSTQTPSGYFTYTFKVKNTSQKIQRLFYKILYQNETYKFQEQHVLAGENFYGSWEETEIKFRTTPPLQPGEIFEGIDSFRIVGNPRNEDRFYGADVENFRLTDSLIQQKMNAISGDENWMNSIRDKATKGKTEVSEQLYLDALWSINNELQNNRVMNNRWKRNPRMGTYQFYLTVVNSDWVYQIPKDYVDITIRDTLYNFKNPLTYFLRNDIKENPSVQTLVSKKRLSTISKIDLSKGIYVDKLKSKRSNLNTSSFSAKCSFDTSLYKTAQIEQYFHDINKDFPLRNIPELGDVVGDNMSVAQYKNFEQKYAAKDKMIITYVNSSDCPCKTVRYDSIKKSVTMINPANTPGEFKKEHVGIRSRIGFTYGKFRAKVKFPALISKQNVWNGLTNAFWLLVQEGDAGWNKRRWTNVEHAYLEKYLPDDQSAMWQSKKQISYSEIDFEILKESQFWPKSSYAHNVPFQEEDASKNNDIMVTCTNWDMANQQPPEFMQGAKKFELDGAAYVWHRWNDWYKAITSKIPASNDELFNSNYYYFEIDWRPEKIIWKIGPEKDKLKTICALSENVSSIPNNQMMILFTQEWHNQEWWPTAPFKQNFVPFPSKDIVGEIMEIEIE